MDENEDYNNIMLMMLTTMTEMMVGKGRSAIEVNDCKKVLTAPIELILHVINCNESSHCLYSQNKG